tara:strand:- start:244 stop:702 length:459 start_codon:yes stop_codon:yes gene_type:complete
MRSSLFLVGCLIAAPSVASERPRLPDEFAIPEYASAQLTLDTEGMPKGIVDFADGRACYDVQALRRLAATLELIEPLSDARARHAWRLGWLNADEQWSARFDEEHALRLEAEGVRDALRAVSEPEPWWKDVLVSSGWAAGGLVAGFLVAQAL